ncbi:MAG: anthranilate synthase component I family protein [Bacteroidetes bacterium]|nr:anthranilate synthase component I family protein [Bacteroidota bacterium]
MKRIFQSFPIQDIASIQQQVLYWSQQSGTCVFLDNHQYQSPYHQYECMAGAGIHRMISANAGNALDQLQQAIDEQPEWWMGHLGYGLTAETSGLPTSNSFIVSRFSTIATQRITNNEQQITSPNRFPDVFFFIPKVLIQIQGHTLSIGSFQANHAELYQEILAARYDATSASTLQLQERISRAAYLDKIETIQHHIRRGDCYELNYCMEFYAEKAKIDPLRTYTALTMHSPNPFSGYYRLDHLHLMCASPERYLAKKGDRLLSQPIKGTIKRTLEDPQKDEVLKAALLSSGKERSENVMVVDMVRNDLSRVSLEGSVKVDELCGVYTFPQLHHLISTVSSQLREGTSFSDIIRATFPMGSMTGAPKHKVIELIHRYEASSRGIFSGALGYITPEGDFDFNVVIRSLVYNQAEAYLSCHVGSGITGYSDAATEYEECLAKAEAINRILKGEGNG